MCGIAGIVDFSGAPLSPDRLVAMGEVQRHRGPDGSGAVLFRIADREAAWLAPGSTPLAGADAGFVHRRLAIIDLSDRGLQPMHEGDGKIWLTYNGEIYNYVELMDELTALGHRFRSRSDTEVIIHAYRQWGPDCVERFNGMFAFALWDVERRRLFCARDRVGIKPLYYLRRGKRLLFGSEIKAILAADEDGPRANVGAISDYLCFSFVPSAETFFRDVFKLPPGHRLLATADGVDIAPYWNPPFQAEPNATDATLVDELRGLLDDAVRIELRSDVPVGAHLSGGIDSSTVCCLAARRIDHLQTFTARFAEGGFFDESSYARLVAETIASEHREIVPSRGDVVDLLPRIIWHLDEPIEGAAVFGKFHVAQIVGSHVKVVLGGQGGDELFGGYDWYVKTLFTAGCFGRTGAIGDRPWLPFALGALRGEPRGRLARSLWNNAGRRDVGDIFRRNWSRMTLGDERRLIRRELFNGTPTSAERFRTSFDALPESNPADRMFHFDLRYYLEALLHSEDRLSMAFSVESRVPLLDHRIVELAARSGFERKTVPGESKSLLRRAVAPIIPPGILARKDKRGFPTPIETWLRDPNLQLVRRFVLEGGDFAAALFDRDRVEKMSEKRVTLGSSWSEVMWRIVNVSAWGSRFGVRL